MEELKQKLGKTEFWVSIAGMAGVVSASLIDSGLISSGTIIYVVLGIVCIVASYVTGRSYVKATQAKHGAVKQPGVTFEVMHPADESISITTGTPGVIMGKHGSAGNAT